MNRPSLTLLLLALLAAACSEPGPAPVSTTEPTTTSTSAAPQVAGPPADAVVFEADVIGGCFMMGPNCARYVVYGDGALETFRLGVEPVELVGTGTVDPVLVSDLWTEVGATDMDGFRASLGPGVCNACVDGVDTLLTLRVGGDVFAFDSAEVDFDVQRPIFALVDLIVRDAFRQVDVPIISR